ERACGDVAQFRAKLIQQSKPDDAALLRRWVPPSPPPAEARTAAENAARNYIEHCGQKEAVELTKQLVKFPTVSASEKPSEGPDFRAMAEFLESFAKQYDLRFNRFGENDAWEITLGEGTRHVAFVMHGDVVPVDASEGGASSNSAPAGWSQPPFEAKLI